MGFLKPFFLFGLALAAMPVIIHFFNRRRLKRVDYSSLFFLRDLKHERFSWLRLRELLLLIARTLLLIFLFLALAHPVFRSRILLGKRKAAVAVVIDDSYSMSNRHQGSSFERAKNQARELIDQLGRGSEVYVALASGGAEAGDGAYGNLAAQRAAIDSLAPSFRADDLKQAVEKAAAVLAASPLADRELFVFTDLQRSALRPLVSTAGRKEIPVYVVDVGARASENAAVVGVELQNPLPSREAPTRLVVRVKNYSDRETVKRVQLVVDREVFERTEKLSAREEKAVVFDKTLVGPGTYAGSAELDPDSLGADDRRFFAFTVQEMIPVLLAYENPADILYLKTALAPGPSGIFSVATAPLANLNREDLERFKVVALVNPVHLTINVGSRLDRYLDAGGSVFVDLGDGLKDQTWFAPWLVYETAYSPSGFLSIAGVDTTHPIFRIFSGSFDPALAKFFKVAKVKPVKASVLARFSDRSPFMLEADDRRVVVATSVFDLDRTDLPLKTMFVPLVHRTFVYLSQGLLKNSYLVGDTISLPAARSAPVTVVTPERSTRLVPVIDGERRTIELGATALPGIYRLGDNVLPVNVAAAEGDLTRAGEREVRRSGLQLVPSVRGRLVDLVQPLLYLALAMLVAEMGLLALPKLPDRAGPANLVRFGRKR